LTRIMKNNNIASIGEVICLESKRRSTIIIH
jgi:hypothetical protein